jgi:hypothetical protein
VIVNARWHPTALLAAAFMALLARGPATAAGKAATYEGKAVPIGQGAAHTVVRTDASGKLAAIGVMFTPGMLDGLPRPATGAEPDFPYLLPMPTPGPRTIVDHVVIDWESVGHPPPHVYDVPHFDFHFYLVSEVDQRSVVFSDERESGDVRQQPPRELLAAGYLVPPGTAVSRMGVHAIDPSAPEFHGGPFTARFLYGYYNRRQTFLEVMASLSFLESKPSFTAPVRRPKAHTKPGAYPSTYSVTYEPARDVYEVTLADLR